MSRFFWQSIRRFFWDEMDGNRRLHWLPWRTICLPKKCGGLGIKNLKLMSAAFLAKLGWKLLTETEPLWVQILLAKYGSPLSPKTRQNASFTWRSIRHAVPVLRRGLDAAMQNDSAQATCWRTQESTRFSVASAYLVQNGCYWSDGESSLASNMAYARTKSPKLLPVESETWSNTNVVRPIQTTFDYWQDLRYLQTWWHE